MADRVRGYRYIEEVIEYDTGEKFHLYLNSKSKEFLAKWHDRQTTKPTGREAIKTMRALIREENKLTFFPVIVVEEAAPFARNVPFVAFTMARTYVAHRPGENRALAQIRWDNYRGDSDLQQYKNPGDFQFRFETLPYIHPGHNSKTYVLAYSDALWSGLISLSELVKRMQSQFRELLSTDVGLRRVEQVGSTALLPSGS